jgi:uncharacterized protein
LVVQERTDVQVSDADAERLVNVNPHAKLKLVDGMNHMLKEVRSKPTDCIVF